MVRFASLHTMLEIVVESDLELVLVDVKTAPLYGELDEEIFMDQPKGLRSEGLKSEAF